MYMSGKPMVVLIHVSVLSIAVNILQENQTNSFAFRIKYLFNT
jgi:hypothetical protein